MQDASLTIVALYVKHKWLKLTKQMRTMVKSFSGFDTLKTTQLCRLLSKNPASHFVLKTHDEIMFYGGTLAGYEGPVQYTSPAE